MKQLFFFLIIFFLLQNFCAAIVLSNKGIDSLIAVLPNTKPDTNRVKILIDLTHKCFPLNTKDGIKFGEQAVALSEKLRWDKGIASANQKLGIYYIFRKDSSKALYCEETALKIFQALNDKREIAITIRNLGFIYRELGESKKSSEYYNKALKHFEEIGDSVGMAKVSSDLISQMMHDQYESEKAAARYDQRIKDYKQRILLISVAAGLFCALIILIVVFRQRNKIILEKKKSDAERKRSEELLLNILPAEVAEELKLKGQSKAKSFTLVTVMFTDFKDFTNVSEKVSAELLVEEIDFCFSGFDNILQKFKIEKIKTIGDAYLCASGLPVSNYTHAEDMVRAAFEIRNFMLHRKKEKEGIGQIPFEIRIGIHTGPVVAGIVGIKKYAYDIWGDTVNIAARMEQNSDAGKINISGSTYELVKDKFQFEYRGKIEAKHKGMIDMYFVVG